MVPDPVQVWAAEPVAPGLKSKNLLTRTSIEGTSKRMPILGRVILGLEMGTGYSTLGAPLDVGEMKEGRGGPRPAQSWHWPFSKPSFINTSKRSTSAQHPARAIDRFGHAAEFDERLLIGSTLDFHIAAAHQYPQPRHSRSTGSGTYR